MGLCILSPSLRDTFVGMNECPRVQRLSEKKNRRNRHVLPVNFASVTFATLMFVKAPQPRNILFMEFCKFFLQTNLKFVLHYSVQPCLSKHFNACENALHL